ncbi:MAG: hypothetical protein KGJ80_14855 [Chloroflexota bacterium]|nr:hypothetical protein [Chloroflexota bacterium]
MPKKTRKMKQRAAERRTLMQQQTAPQAAAGETAPVGDAPMRMRPEFAAGRVVTPLSYDYSHIYSDLKRIALFAGFFFAVLIVLSFVIK